MKCFSNRRARKRASGSARGVRREARRQVRRHTSVLDLQADVEGARLLLREVLEGRRLLRGRLDEEGLERLHGDDPGGDGGGEVLGGEGAERNVLPLLQVARAPVVQQHHP